MPSYVWQQRMKTAKRKNYTDDKAEVVGLQYYIRFYNGIKYHVLEKDGKEVFRTKTYKQLVIEVDLRYNIQKNANRTI